MPALDDLVTELARLPGIGRKTAQRLAYHLLQRPAGEMERLGATLAAAAAKIRPCGTCGDFTEDDPCELCRDPRRDATLLCVVEDPSGVAAMERAAGFRGRYHVLGGRLSPLDGVGPESLRIDALLARIESGVREVILATNPSMEGEATATYLQQLLDGKGVRVTRLARGLPMGGDLDYVDGVTLAHAMSARQDVR